MRPADLIERLAFDKPVKAADGRGGETVTMTEQFQARGHFRYLRGGETVQAARLEGRQPIVITIHNFAEALGIAPDWGIRDLGRTALGTLQVKAVVESEDRRWIEITAERGVAG